MSDSVGEVLEQILKNQLVIMDALSRLLPTPVQCPPSEVQRTLNYRIGTTESTIALKIPRRLLL